MLIVFFSVPLKFNEAQNARDALAKALYVRLFDYIVSVVNKSIPFSSSISYIGILDIAGFEYFPINSFEQFCIKYDKKKKSYWFRELFSLLVIVMKNYNNFLMNEFLKKNNYYMKEKVLD
jgi:hypothetical protein